MSFEGRQAILTLHGELDLSSSAALEDELHRVDGTPLVVIDLRKLEFIDSTGLGVLVKTHQQMRQANSRLVLVDGEGQVRRLLAMTGLSDQLIVVDSTDQALDGG